MRVLGVDPGLRGGIAVLEDRVVLYAGDIPVMGVKGGQRVNASSLFTLLKWWGPDHAFIERAQAMPKQGASSGFIYGRATGAIEAVVAAAGIPLTIVEPNAWKKAMGLRGKDKEAARQKALMLFPGAAPDLARKMDHGRAEAILIALYGR